LSDGNWDLEKYSTVSFCPDYDAPVLSMTPVTNRIWGGSQNKILVINPQTLKHEVIRGELQLSLLPPAAVSNLSARSSVAANIPGDQWCEQCGQLSVSCWAWRLDLTAAEPSDKTPSRRHLRMSSRGQRVPGGH